MAAAPAPSTASAMKWFAVATMTNTTSSGYSAQKIFSGRHLTSFDSGIPIMSANATCIEGTAAYGLKRLLIVTLSCATPVKSETASKKPYSGKNRGGAVGNVL